MSSSCKRSSPHGSCKLTPHLVAWLQRMTYTVTCSQHPQTYHLRPLRQLLSVLQTSTHLVHLSTPSPQQPHQHPALCRRS